MSFFNNFKGKFRIVILHADTYEEKGGFHTSKLNVLVFILLTVLLIVTATTCLIFFTPIRELIPGYTDVSLNRRVYQIERSADSIETVLRQKDLYIENIHRIVFDEEMSDSLAAEALINKGVKPITKMNDVKSKKDSAFRARYEADMKANHVEIPDISEKWSVPTFVSPIAGKVTSPFDANLKHFGVDLVSASNTAVNAIADGTIILAEQTKNKDFIIVIQHDNNIISVYRHNRSLMHYEGDNVNAGDAIAIIGGTKNQPKKAYLHLELWFRGEPVDPEDYISFE